MPVVAIDPVPDQIVGTGITISGTITNPGEGDIRIYVYPYWFDPFHGPLTTTEFKHWINTPVTPLVQPNGTYQWNVTIDTAKLKPERHLIAVTSYDYFLLSENTASFDLKAENGMDKTYTIDIQPIQKNVIGNPLTISGTTDINEAKTVVAELIDPDGFTVAEPAWTKKEVRGIYSWSVTFNTTGLSPGNYTCRVSAFDGTVSSNRTCELFLPKTAEKTQTPGFGSGILALAFTTAIVFGAVRKK